MLDPFVGSGTTVVVADALGRHGIGLDLKLDYLKRAQVDLSIQHRDFETAQALRREAKPVILNDLPMFAETL